MQVDVAVVGGGLAGLSAGIIARRMGYSVALFEKKQYPFHKVCGEYLSLESLDLLQWLGLPVSEMDLPVLNKFRITHPNGKEFNSELPLGGIGISRFTLDHFLKKKLEEEGGLVFENSKVSSVEKSGNGFSIRSSGEETESRFVLGSFGRNKPSFAEQNSEGRKRPKGFVGVKLHIKANLPKDRIELHHFPGGYCGISAIEEGAFCLCYLIDDQLVRDCKGNLEEAEVRFLHQNKQLKTYFEEFPQLTKRVSTSGVMFAPRPLSKDGMLFLGDAAGMIPPLAGNGMSMAFHSSVLAMESAHPFLSGISNLEEAVRNYESSWKDTFSSRLASGRFLQKIMEQPGMTALTMTAFRAAPFLFRMIASGTHGTKIPLPQIRKI